MVILETQKGFEVRDGDSPIKEFPYSRRWERSHDSFAKLEAIEYVRKKMGYGAYYDFSAILRKS